MRFGRIIVGAVLLEVGLIALAVPLFALMSNPFIAGAESPDGDYTPIFVVIAALCFVIGGACGWWVARPLSSQIVLHGALTGILATAIYLAVCSIPPNTIPMVVAAYGPFWFLLANGLRIAGSTFGAAYQQRAVRARSAAYVPQNVR